VQVAKDYLQDHRRLPAHAKPCVPDTLEATLQVVKSNKVAPFLREFGDAARAALSLKAPTLAVAPSTTGEPVCQLCGVEPESPRHLVNWCTGLPCDVVERSLQVRGATRGKKTLPFGYATSVCGEWSASLQWEGRTRGTAARHLWFAGRAVDFHSKRAAPPPPEEEFAYRRTVRLRSASRVRQCSLSPVCRGRAALGHGVPSLAGWLGAGTRCDLALPSTCRPRVRPFRVEGSSQHG
jgi:hypothetical protein